MTGIPSETTTPARFKRYRIIARPLQPSGGYGDQTAFIARTYPRLPR